MSAAAPRMPRPASASDRQRASPSGVLPVDKGAGVTSFAVVARVRRLLGGPKLGHGGTLDPDATGVLPILVGEATKLMPYLADLEKEYVAAVRLGVVTDTQDISGAVLQTRTVPSLEVGALQAVLARFVGEIEQVPPMYSALHHEGRRLYEIAREGGTVERAARRVQVHAIALEALAPDELTMRVRCGEGTYVRTLAADLGEALGCGAAVARLCARAWGRTTSPRPCRGTAPATARCGAALVGTRCSRRTPRSPDARRPPRREPARAPSSTVRR